MTDKTKDVPMANLASHSPNRRQFVKHTVATAATTGLAMTAFASRVHAAGDDVLKVGLIGCGGRGTGAANQALQADENVRLVAMGDAFEDRLQLSLKTLSETEEVAGRIDVPEE